MNKARKQIYIDVWQNEKLAELAQKSKVTEAEIIRQALDQYFLTINELPPEHPLSHLAGIGASSSSDFGAKDHDKIIYKC